MRRTPAGMEIDEMKRIVVDSSASLYKLDGVDFAAVPLKIVTDEREYLDDGTLNAVEMATTLRTYKGKTSTSCPNIGDWLEAYEGADEIYAITITGTLSGSCNAAQLAAEEYQAEHPGAQVFVLDSLSAGPELVLLAEHIRALIEEGRDFDEVCEEMLRYRHHTHLLFSLESLANLARNGRVKPAVAAVARMLNISGPFNMQLMAKDNEIKVIECNLRASRSFPFVSKVLKVNFIDIATKVMLGVDPEVPHKSAFELDYVGIKAPQFSFSRLQKADPVLGVEMASTGEVGCIGEDFHEAILKSMISVGYAIPKKNILLSTGDSRSKMDMLSAAKALQQKGYNIFATKGTAAFLELNGVHATVLHWPDQNEQPNTLDYIKEKKIDLVVNIPKNLSKDELNNDYTIRRSAIDFNIPLITNARLASAFITAFCRLAPDEIQIKSWNEY